MLVENQSISRLNAIINIPIIRPNITQCPWPYSWAAGNNSSTDIKTIMPATKAKRNDKSYSDKKGSKIRNPTSAPIGSEKPEKKEYTKAFFLSPVA